MKTAREIEAFFGAKPGASGAMLDTKSAQGQPPLDFSVGGDLRRLRKRLGLTQPAFADLLGTSLGSIEIWEHGLRKIPRYIRNHLRYIDRFGPMRD